MFSFNTTIHTSTKFSPYELIFGIKPSLPSSITSQPQFKYSYDNYLDDLKLKLQKSHQIAKDNLVKSKEINKKYYDKNSKITNYTVGDMVFLTNEQAKIGKSKKLTNNYNGPYKIIEVNSNSNCTLLVNRKKIKVHVDRLKHAFVSD